MNQKIFSSADGACLAGTMLTIASPEAAELLSLCHFDWLLIDMEHTNISYSSAQRMIQAVGQRIPVLVRVPENNANAITKALDIGSAGIVVPMVNTPEQASRAVSAAKYPPQGTRGVGIGRAQGYGQGMASYIQSANETVSVIIMIEQADAVAQIESILEVEGIDGVLIGPYDLSGSVGTLGDTSGEAVQAAIQTTKLACARRSIPFGLFVGNPDAISSQIEGCQFALLATDTLILGRAATDLTARARQTHRT